MSENEKVTVLEVYRAVDGSLWGSREDAKKWNKLQNLGKGYRGIRDLGSVSFLILVEWLNENEEYVQEILDAIPEGDRIK